MSETVPWQERDADAVERSDHDRIGRIAVRSPHADLLRAFETGHLVEAAAADEREPHTRRTRLAARLPRSHAADHLRDRGRRCNRTLGAFPRQLPARRLDVAAATLADRRVDALPEQRRAKSLDRRPLARGEAASRE